MSLNWTNVKSLAIPVGGVSRDVKRVSIGGSVVWEKPSPLPYDAEVEYLESTGTQWIDTGYKLNNNCRVELLLTAESPGYNRNIFGCRTSFASKNFSCNMVGSYGYTVDFDNSNTTAYRATSSASSKFLARIVADKNERTIYNETAGTTLVTNTTACPDVFTCDYGAYLFNTSGSPYHNNMMVGRLYSCKFWDNGVLVRDYIPVRVGTVGYLYDRVSGALFGNAGTGAFTYGADLPYPIGG